MKRTLFLTAGVQEILFWSMFVRQPVLYMGQDMPVWYYGVLNFYGWPIESGPTGWGLNWAPLLLNLARFSGLFLVVCAAAFCLSGKSRERWFLAYAVPTLPLALTGILISTADIHCRRFLQTILVFHFLFQPAFLLFAVGVLFRKVIRWGMSTVGLYEPYENYSLYSKLPPEELKARLAALCPRDRFFPLREFKALLKPAFTFFTFRERCGELVLLPLGRGRNTFLPELRLELYPQEDGTRLEVTANIPKVNRIFLWGMSIFILVFSVVGWLFGLWQTLFALAAFPFLFGVVAVIRSAAESELPKIREGFEELLRKAEES